MKAPALAVLVVVIVGAPATAQEPTLKNSIGMEFMLITPGSMQVGVFQPVCPQPGQGRGRGDPRSQWNDADYRRCEELAKQDASPGFSVTIKNPYYIGKYEVTQEQWTALMGKNPSAFQGARVADDAAKHPVDSVTWQDAQAFVKKLNAVEKTSKYRLPTEFEWEYAGRAGGSGQTSWTVIRQAAVLGRGAPGRKATTSIVGSKQPNAWGLYDMLGNVWEWVDDIYNEKLFADAVPPTRGAEHVLKGGGFLSDVKNAIYATHGAGPGSGFDVGFRLVRDP
jgi:formylglycine-generating enzyme required for sulfatase activity